MAPGPKGCGPKSRHTALRAALPDKRANINVLNGIAWDAANRRLYLTGKNWPRLFEIAWPPEALDRPD